MPIQSAVLTAWLERIEALHPNEIELGLDRVRHVLRALGAPRPPLIVTIAGTNGKGSTVALLAAILGAAGYRVGTYTSPHLLRFNERIQINGVPVGDATLCAAFERVEAARGGTSLTYFEFTTLAALCVLHDTPLDVALLEVGLGGRLDAVNCVDPDLAMITALDVDHVSWLGGDRETIAREKAGIFRAGIEAVCADPEPPASLLDEARIRGTTLHILGRDFQHAIDAYGWRWSTAGRERHGLPPPSLKGRCQFDNAAAVLMALECLADRLPVGQGAIRRGLVEVELPGRFQVVPGPVTYILDVAHNPQAARMLAATLQVHPCTGRTLAVVGMLADKAVDETLAALVPVIDQWITATLEPPRGLAGEGLAEALQRIGAAADIHVDVAAALGAAEAAATDGDRVVVFGSFMTVAAALRAGL